MQDKPAEMNREKMQMHSLHCFGHWDQLHDQGVFSQSSGCPVVWQASKLSTGCSETIDSVATEYVLINKG